MSRIPMILGVAGIVMIDVSVTLYVVNTTVPTRDLATGWYRWADQSNSPARFAPAAMSNFDMSARCLCQEGFKVRDVDAKTFRVVSAPPGYQDTVGKEFVAKQRVCLNCAD